MTFDLWQPKAEPRMTRRSAPLRVEELSKRILLSDVGGGYPEPILPPPDPVPAPPAENGNGG